MFGRSSWVFGESIKAFLKGATYPLSAAISFLEHDISSAWNVIKVGGSVREFSTCGRKLMAADLTRFRDHLKSARRHLVRRLAEESDGLVPKGKRLRPVALPPDTSQPKRMEGKSMPEPNAYNSVLVSLPLLKPGGGNFMISRLQISEVNVHPFTRNASRVVLHDGRVIDVDMPCEAVEASRRVLHRT